MFLTYPEFKFRTQINSEPSAIWKTVELAVPCPILICSVQEAEDRRLCRSLLLTNERDVLGLDPEDGHQRVRSLHLLLPPSRSESRDWECLRIGCVYVTPSSEEASGERVVLLAEDGVCYAGAPLGIVAETFAALRPVMHFPNYRWERGIGT